MALDHPDRVSALAVLDIAPTGATWTRAERKFAFIYWHWGFLAQPPPLPERLILGDPDAYFDHHVLRIGLGASEDRYPAEVVAAYRAQLHDPATVEAICEDYRAGATCDVEHDGEGGRIACPVLVLWGTRGAMELFYGDLLELWRPLADDVHGRSIDASHFLVEDDPDAVLGELLAFFPGD
jgi:haloacetate dehalogenase